jgi:hypothetical protein
MPPGPGFGRVAAVIYIGTAPVNPADPIEHAINPALLEVATTELLERRALSDLTIKRCRRPLPHGVRPPETNLGTAHRQPLYAS